MLTEVQDPVPGPAPPPALQLLVLRVLQPAVMENHTDDALAGKQGEELSVGAKRDPEEPTCRLLSQGTPPSRLLLLEPSAGAPTPLTEPQQHERQREACCLPFHTATCQSFCAHEHTEAQKSSVSDQPGAQSLSTARATPALGCPSPWESTRVGVRVGGGDRNHSPSGAFPEPHTQR